MIGKDTPPSVGKKTQFKKGQSGNPNGREEGSKNLATMAKEMENEKFDWALVPIKQKDAVKKIGSPWRAILYTAIAQAIAGNVKAMEWLRKAAYGDKVDITSAGKRLIQRPVIIADIKPRKNVETETETTESS